MKNIGSRIRSLREQKVISLSKLAEQSGLSKGLLHRIEAAEDPNPELGTLRKIARVLDTTVGDLLGNEVVKNTRQLPNEHPEWLKQLVRALKEKKQLPDEDLLEALYVIQNRKGQNCASTEDWVYVYQTLERSFARS